MNSRFLPFVAVGAAGFAVQMSALWLLTGVCGWTAVPATLAAVEAAVLHNFVWHERWTWRHHRADSSVGHRLWRFHLGNAATSLAGNLAVTTMLVGWMEAPVILANACAVGLTSLVNFALAERWVFTPRVRATVAAGIVSAGLLASAPLCTSILASMWRW